MKTRDNSHDIKITWMPEDAQTLRPKMSIREAKAFFKENRKWIQDRSIELGWEVIEILLADWDAEKKSKH